MKIDLAIIQIALIFFPGIIWSALYSNYAKKKDVSNFQFIVNAFLFGIISYVLLFLIYTQFGIRFDLVSSVVAKTASKAVDISSLSDEIIWATILATLLGVASIYGSNKSLLTRFLQYIRVTNRYGDEDVWDYTFNSASEISEFVNVRDFENEITYSGYVFLFSETEKLRELVLRDAKVFDFEGNLLFQEPHLYISRNPDNMHVEFPIDTLETE